MAATRQGAAMMRHLLQLQYEKEMPALQKAMPEIQITYLTWLELRVMLAKTKPEVTADVGDDLRMKIREPFGD